MKTETITMTLAWSNETGARYEHHTGGKSIDTLWRYREESTVPWPERMTVRIAVEDER